MTTVSLESATTHLLSRRIFAVPLLMPDTCAQTGILLLVCNAHGILPNTITKVSGLLNCHGRHAGLWCKEDQFYYDWVVDDKGRRPIAVRSLVGLLPLIAVEILDQRHIEPLTGFMERTNWFLDHRKHLADSVSSLSDNGDMRLLSCCSKERLTKILEYLFDEDEFLSPFGLFT